jgi:hypothetical protein
MELIAEILSALFQFLLEVALQFSAELLTELGAKSIGEMLKPSRPPRPALTGFGYVLTGGVAGWMSLWWFPIRFAESPGLRLMTLVMAPVVSALILWVFLTLIGRPATPEGRRSKFWFAYAFGLSFALVRFTFGR